MPRGRPRKSDAAPAVAQSPPKKRGRPARVAQKVAEPASVDATANDMKKTGRGRTRKSEPEPEVAQSEPKRRGRAAKAEATAPAEEVPGTVRASGRGRPKRGEVMPEVAQPTEKRRGRPSKSEQAPEVQEAIETVKTSARGRPRGHAAKNVSIAEARKSPRANKTTTQPAVAGPVRVAKKRGRGRPSITTSVAVPRVNARIRSKLRDRKQPQHAKMEAAAKAEKANATVSGRGRPKKSMGRPPKNATTPAAASPGRKTARDAVKKTRVKRGHITMEVPKKFVAQVQQLLLELQAEEDARQAEEEQKEEEEKEEEEEEEEETQNETGEVEENEVAEASAATEVQEEFEFIEVEEVSGVGNNGDIEMEEGGETNVGEVASNVEIESPIMGPAVRVERETSVKIVTMDVEVEDESEEEPIMGVTPTGRVTPTGAEQQFQALIEEEAETHEEFATSEPIAAEVPPSVPVAFMAHSMSPL